MKIDNTIEVVIFEYLKIQKELLSDTEEKSFKKQLSKYECCIDKAKLNKEFGTTNKSYKELINDLLLCLRKYYQTNNIEENVKIMKELGDKTAQDYRNTSPIDYKDNLELYFYALYYYFYSAIQSSYDNNLAKDDIVKKYSEEINEQIKKLKSSNKSEINDEIKLIKTSDKSKVDEKVEMLQEQLKYIPLIYGTYGKYLFNISYFIDETYEKFNKRFENFKLNEEKELFLYENYLFFLTNFPFHVDIAIRNYIHIWNDTFEDLKIVEKIDIVKNFSKDGKNFSITGNKLNVSNKLNKKYIIENIDDYSLKPLLEYLNLINHVPDLIELNEFLKIDKYMGSLYIKKIWDTWESFLIKLFTSNVVKTLFDKMFKKKGSEDKLNPYHFIDENVIKLIINKVKYFIFPSHFEGMTIGKTLSIYLNGNPFEIKDDKTLSKLDYLSHNVKSNLHEIIGHLNVRIQYYLTKDKRYLSPKPQNPSRQALQRKGKEAGEFLEEILFGAFAGALELEQMLYILDIKNYDKQLDKFREDFIKWGKEKEYPISEELKTFLSKLDIDSPDIYFKNKNSNYLAESHKSFRNKKNSHNSPMIGYDDIYFIDNNNDEN